MRVDSLQTADRFALANDRLGGSFSYAARHKVLTLSGRTGPAAQCVFTGIREGVKCEVSMWSDPVARGIAGRSFLRAVFGVAFNQWGCVRVTAFTRASNDTARRAIEAMGFTFEARLVAWFGSEDGLCFRMLRPECRWID